MAKKRVVYSTNPDWEPPYESDQNEVAPDRQVLRVGLEKKGRRGKSVSILTGFVGNDDSLKSLAKDLKTACGTGGSAKNGEIIIQGDHRDRIVAFLKESGYTNVKKSGG